MPHTTGRISAFVAVLLGSLALCTSAQACSPLKVDGNLHLGANSTHFGVIGCASETAQSNSNLVTLSAEAEATQSPWSGNWLISAGSDFFSFNLVLAGPPTGTLEGGTAYNPDGSKYPVPPYAGTVTVPLAVAWEPWAALHIRCRVASFDLTGRVEGGELQTGTLTATFTQSRAKASSTCPGLLAWFVNEWLFQLRPGTPESATASIEIGQGAKPL